MTWAYGDVLLNTLADTGEVFGSALF